MARNLITNPRRLAELSQLLGQPVLIAWARGGTDHRVDAGLVDGSIMHVYKDGTFELAGPRWEPERLKTRG